MEAWCATCTRAFIMPPPPISHAILPSSSRLGIQWPRSTPLRAHLRVSAVSKSAHQVQEKTHLKEELLTAIQATEEGLDDNCLSIIAALEQLKHVPDIAAQPHLLKGSLVGIKANFRENRKDGQKRYLGFTGALTTLGATTFNALKPADLQIALYTGYQEVSIDSPESYVIVAEVGIMDPDGPLVGVINNRARFFAGGPNRLQVEFLSSEIKPKFPEKDLDAWLKVLKEHNPGMDDNGFVVVPYPKPIRGWTDILYMDDEIRIHRGHKGGVSVLQLLKDGEVST